MAEELVTVATFTTAAEAAAVRVGLEGEGLTVFLSNDEVVSSLSYLGNAFGYVKLQVPASQAAQAHELLKEHGHHFEGEAASEDEPVSYEHTHCPECDEPLASGATTCPQCGHELDYDADDDGQDDEEEEQGSSILQKMSDLRLLVIGPWVMFQIAFLLLLGISMIWVIISLFNPEPRGW